MDALSPSTQLADHAAEIRALSKRVVGDVIEIGRRLTECKRIAGYGQWLSWLKREFQWAESTAERYIRSYEVFGSNPSHVTDLPDLPLRTFYLLAAPSTSEAARNEVLEQAKSGRVSHE